DVAGWIEDVKPLLDSARLMVAPLTYGAGIKGKVTQCLASGLPVVTTTIGAEGIDADRCMLIADDPRDLAEHVARAYTDDELWRRLSREGQAFIAENCSSRVAAHRISVLLGGTPSPAQGVGHGQPARIAPRSPREIDALKRGTR
ncbi:MAG: glycosyltransferase family 4 protein, partial [Solirubrobacteraceae bacterium]